MLENFEFADRDEITWRLGFHVILKRINKISAMLGDDIATLAAPRTIRVTSPLLEKPKIRSWKFEMRQDNGKFKQNGILSISEKKLKRFTFWILMYSNWAVQFVEVDEN